MDSRDTYRLLDSGDFRKLEQVGPYRISRPAPSAVWDPVLSEPDWRAVDAEFVRHKDGSGEWRVRREAVQKPFEITIDGIVFQIRLTSFGHLGLFPEQRANWRRLEEYCAAGVKAGRTLKVLNLFAYTGGSSLFCARGGAEVAHVDASKGTVRWASENAQASGLSEKPLRWLVDDVTEFVRREARRGSRYDGLILDPPSYGKGEKKQVWKIEKDLMPLLRDLKKIFNETAGNFICLSAHSEGYTPLSLRNQLLTVFGSGRSLTCEEMVIEDGQGRVLPSGASAILAL